MIAMSKNSAVGVSFRLRDVTWLADFLDVRLLCRQEPKLSLLMQVPECGAGLKLDHHRNPVEMILVFGFDATLSPAKFQQPTSTVFIFVSRRPDGVQGEFKLRGQKKALPGN